MSDAPTLFPTAAGMAAKDNKKDGKKPVDTSALAEKLDAELNTFLTEKLEKGNKTGYEYVLDQTPEELAADLKKHPAFMTELDPSEPLSEATEGMMAMQYESDSPTANAENYKDEGNALFKKMKYRLAIKNFAAGVAIKCEDATLNAQLHGNSAAAHVRLQNWRSAFLECEKARKCDPDYLKAIIRGGQCLKQLKRYKECLEWTDRALILSPDHKDLLTQRTFCINVQQTKERNDRKEQFKKNKEQKEAQLLLLTIKNRNIRFDKHIFPTPDNRMQEGKVQLNDGILSWPMLLLYPEYSETDYIIKSDERSTFTEHLENMFGTCISWDKKREYTPENIKVYFEDRFTQTLYLLEHSTCLRDAIQHPKYFVREGTPSFIILVDNSFSAHYLQQYSIKKFNQKK